MKEHSIPKNLQTENTKENEQTIDEMIKEVADEQGMTFEEAKKLYYQGLEQYLKSPKPISAKEKANKKKKRKLAKKSKRKNR